MLISLSPIGEALADERLLQRVLQDGLHVGGELSFPTNCNIICFTKKTIFFLSFYLICLGHGVSNGHCEEGGEGGRGHE